MKRLLCRLFGHRWDIDRAWNINRCTRCGAVLSVQRQNADQSEPHRQNADQFVVADEFGERGLPTPEGYEHVGWIDIAGNLWPVEPYPDDRASDRPLFAPVQSGRSGGGS